MHVIRPISRGSRTGIANRAVSLLASCLVAVAAPALGAQATTTIPAPRVQTNATIAKPAQPTMSKVPKLTPTMWEATLQVSSDGMHWSGAASTSWANPCPDTPGGCGQSAPVIPVHLRWQAWDSLVTYRAMAALNGTYYYYSIKSQLTGNASPAPAATCDRSSATSGLATSNQYDAQAIPNLKPGDSMVCTYTVRTRDVNGNFHDTGPVTFTIHVTAAHP